MSDPFQFPEHPLSNKKDPFRDDQGKNPFSNGENPAAPRDDLYASADMGEIPEPQPDDYQATLAPRGATILWLGTAAAVFGGLGMTGLAMTLFGRIGWLGNIGLTEFVPLSLLGFGFALAAWIMGQHDLRAMKAGAMHRKSQVGTRLGFFVGLFISLLTVIVYITLLTTYVVNRNLQ